MPGDDEGRRLRSVAMQNASSILVARQRAERELIDAQEALKLRAAELAKSLETLRATLEATSDAILVVDEAGNISAFNAHFVALWEFSPEVMERGSRQEMLSLAMHRLEEPAAFLTRSQSIDAENPPQSFDVLKFADGRVFERSSKVQRLGDQVKGRVWSYRDVTSQQRAEEELRRQREWFEVTLQSIGDAVVTTDTRAMVTYLNPEAARLTGWTSTDAVGQPLADVFRMVHEETRAPVPNPLMKVLASGETVSLANHTALIARNERETAIEDSAAPIKDGNGKAVGAVMVFRDVTERRRSENALRVSHDQFAAILNQSPVGVYLVDAALRIRHVNPTAQPVFKGFKEVLGQDLGEVLEGIWDGEIADEVMRRFRHTLETGEPFLSKGFSAQSHERPVQEYYDWEIHRIVLPSGQYGVVCYFIDISTHVLSQNALRRSEEELRALADSIPNLAWMASPDGAITWYNRGWYDYTGTSPADMQGWGWQSVHRADMLPLVVERWRASVQSGTPFEMEFPLRGANGEFRWFLTRVNPLRDETDAIVRWFGTNTDIDAVRRAGEKVQEETRILDLLNSTGQAIAAKLDLETLVQTVTDAGTELSGAKFGAFFYNVVNAQGKALLLYTLSGAPREAFEKFGLPRATPVFSPTFHGEGVVRSGDITQDSRYGTMPPHYGMPTGHLPVRSYLAVPVIARSGEVIGGLFFGHPETDVFTERSERLIVGVAAQAAVAIDNARLYEAAQKEIAERKSAQKELAERERLSTLRADAAALLAVSVDIDATLRGCCELLVQHLDAAFARIWVLDETQPVLVLRASAGLYTHLDGPHSRVPLGQFKIGRIGQSRRAHLTNDVAHDPNISDPAWAAREEMISFAGYPLISDNRLLGVLALFARQPLSDAVLGDLSPLADAIAATIQRRQAQVKLVEAKERAEVASRAKDDFLAALSHELRTPLTPVLMTAAALRKDERLPEDVRLELSMIERNIGLEARLIDDLLDLTRITNGKLQLRQEICDAHSLIRLAAEIVRDEAQTKPVGLELTLGARRTTLPCDPARIQQVVWNLLRNAIKFTPAGGRVSIKTMDGPDGRLRIEVQDTGIGISPEALTSVFERFEQAGRQNDHRFGGLGLGLPIARAIAELHGGEIWAESAGPGLGATFVVELPDSKGRDVGPTTERGAPCPSPCGGPPPLDAPPAPLRLLVVEDHEPTVAVLHRLLVRSGHEVVTAGTVAAALLSAKGTPFDVVISDMGLPDGTGLDLMERLRFLQPKLKGIALSGYGMEHDLERSRAAGFSTHLVKPIDFDQLRLALQEVSTSL